MQNYPGLSYNLACGFASIVLGVLLFINIRRKANRNTKHYFNALLISAILVCLQDILWTLVDNNVIPKTSRRFILCQILMIATLSAMGVCWLSYTSAIDDKDEYRKLRRYAAYITLGVNILLVPILLVFPNVWIRDGNVVFYLYLFPIGINLVLLSINDYICFRKIRNRNAYMHRNEYLLMAIAPFVLFAVISAQGFMDIEIPLFAYGVILSFTILMILTIIFQSGIDNLTGLSNRSELTHYLDGIERDNRNNVVVMIDMNCLKQINDTKGHNEGDNCLALIGRVVRRFTLSQKTASFGCRYGGDEFVVIVTNARREDFVNLETQFNAMMKAMDTKVSASVSIGVADWKTPEIPFRDAILDADRDMYENKMRFHQGRPS